MCSTDYGMLDLLFDKDDPSKPMSDSFRNTLFTSDKYIQDPNLVKEEVIDSGIAQNIDWKMNTDWDADELLRSVLDGDVNSSMASISSLDFNRTFSQVLNTSKPSPTLSSYPNLAQVATPTLQTIGGGTIQVADDMDAIENLVGLPFHAVMEQNHESLDLPMDSAASDSGLSSLDQQFSPNGYSVGSPDSSIVDLGSPSHSSSTLSEVSSTSDLGSLMSLGTVPESPTSTTFNTFSTGTPNSPDRLTPFNGTRLIDPLGLDSGFSSPASSVTSVVSPNCSIANSSISPMVIPISTAAVRLAHAPVTVVNSSAALPTPTTTVPVSQHAPAPTVLKTVLASNQTTSNSNSLSGQTIVVTQASKGGQPTAHLVKGGTFLKTNNTSRSILLPVTVKDLNQVRTIKIISTGGNGTNVTNGRAVRTVVSTVRPTVSTCSTSTTPVRAATLLSRDTKSLLKGATVVTTRPSLASTTTTTTASSIGIKQETLDDDDDDEPDPLQNTFQQIILSDEEKRLLKKEGIQLPSHYPLTKQEERELKRIRRKIRNKISAQDSRKRKKEYIDGLEDRVKACTDENQQLQKRIRTLEQQNDNLLAQMRRFQSMVANGISGSGRGSHTHASTAIMMLVLSAALFIVPSLRPQDHGNEKELSMPSSKMPNAGHTRSLLVAPGAPIVPATLEGLEEVEEEVVDGEQLIISALNDHDYAPPAKRQKLATLFKKDPYFNPPIDDVLPRKGQTDGGDDPPDDDPPIGKLSAKILDILDKSLVNNISDTGGQKDSSRSIVVNLHNKTKFNRIRDDLELE